METKRSWTPAQELEDTDDLLSSGAVPEETAYSVEDIMKEYGKYVGPAEAGGDPSEDVPEPAEPPAGEPEAEPEESEKPAGPTLQETILKELDLDTTANFIGQQVSDAMSEEQDEAPVGEPTESSVAGLKKLFLDGQRRIAESRRRKESQRRERDVQEAMEEAAQAMTEEADRVVEMPAAKGKFFRDSFGRIQDKWHDFADNMYADAGTPQQDHSGVFVAKTDEEEVPEEEEPEIEAVPLRERRRRKPQPKAPDLSADELSGRYRLGLNFMQTRLRGLLLLGLVMLYLSIAESCGLPLLSALLDHQMMSGILTWCLALGCAIGLDVLWLGLTAPFRGGAGMHTLTALAVLATLADGLYSAIIGREGPLPFSAMALFCLLGAGLGAYQRKKALYMTCRTAASASEPYRVTLDEKKWNGMSAFCKETGTSQDFGSQIQGPDGASRIYRLWVPVLIAAALVCAIVASVGQGLPGMLTWCLSTILLAASPLAGLMAFGQPYLRLTKRLDRSGTALAGWEGAKSMSGKANVLLKDEDLFPEGTIVMKSIRPFGDVSLEKVTGCTASMLRSAGSGLYHLFDTELRRLGGFYRRVENLQCYEAGGLSADIRNDQVLIGTYGFLNVMGIKWEPEVKVKKAVYCVINKQLECIFILDYTMSNSDKAALSTLIRGGVQPVLVPRDFNVIPSMLQGSRLYLPVEKMEYPPIERRRELSEPGQPHNPVLGALLTREGMVPYADAIIGARRLQTVVRVNAIIAVLASLVGVVLSFYLTWLQAFDSLTPLSMLVFLVIWAIPNIAISSVIDKF